MACPASFYCPAFGMIIGTACEAGSYCPGSDDVYPGSATFIQIRPTPCPAGTYGSPASASASSDCITCAIGKYCDTPGQLITGGTCDSGFVCGTGNDRPGPYATTFDGVSGNSGKCSAAHYCSAGSTTQEPCPSKEYSDTAQSSTCLTCPPGSYCTGGSSK